MMKSLVDMANRIPGLEDIYDEIVNDKPLDEKIKLIPRREQREIRAIARRYEIPPFYDLNIEALYRFKKLSFWYGMLYKADKVHFEQILNIDAINIATHFLSDSCFANADLKKVSTAYYFECLTNMAKIYAKVYSWNADLMSLEMLESRYGKQLQKFQETFFGQCFKLFWEFPVIPARSLGEILNCGCFPFNIPHYYLTVLIRVAQQMANNIPNHMWLEDELVNAFSAQMKKTSILIKDLNIKTELTMHKGGSL